LLYLVDVCLMATRRVLLSYILAVKMG